MMLRQRENSDSFKAGVFSVLVHTVLLGALLISFNWKTMHPVSIAQVELWDSVAVKAQPAPLPEPVIQPVPVEKELPKREPVAEPEVKPEPNVEIAIKKKIEKSIKKEPPKHDAKVGDARKKLLEQMRQEDLKSAPKVMPRTNDDLKKMQQELLSEDKAPGEQKAAVVKSAASAAEVGEFTDRISAKIRSNVNKTLCGNGNPELKFEIGLIPTGELSGAPRLVKSSGNAACDDAVERAIRVSEPLPLPQDASLFSQFRNLKLTFHPNDN